MRISHQDPMAIESGTLASSVIDTFQLVRRHGRRGGRNHRRAPTTQQDATPESTPVNSPKATPATTPRKTPASTPTRATDLITIFHGHERGGVVVGTIERAVLVRFSESARKHLADHPETRDFAVSWDCSMEALQRVVAWMEEEAGSPDGNVRPVPYVVGDGCFDGKSRDELRRHLP